ncbi:MAG TPA: CdaR family protein [Pyrinomonadaceae bacterium]|nr:CdaR family protein [Pyrinomonadaceae bacterium]
MNLMVSYDPKLNAGQQQTLVFKNILRKIFLEDWPMKLIALAISVALWIGVTGLSAPTIQRMSGIPLTLRLSSNVDVTNSPNQEVDIVISGDSRKIDQINKNDLNVSVDLTDLQPGDRVIQLTPATVLISLPNGVKLDEIQPRQIAVRLEPIEVREIPVNVTTEGEPADGFEVYSASVSPEKVNVRGPANLMRSLASVSTDKIDLTNRAGDFTATQVSVNVTNSKATLLEPLVDVTFSIGEKRIERTYRVQVRDDPSRRVTVVLFGGRSLFEGVQDDDIFVEMSRDAAGKEQPVVILPPSLAGSVEIRRPRPVR